MEAIEDLECCELKLKWTDLYQWNGRAIKTAYCQQCNSFYSRNGDSLFIQRGDQRPLCAKCNAIAKVLFLVDYPHLIICCPLCDPLPKQGLEIVPIPIRTQASL